MGNGPLPFKEYHAPYVVFAGLCGSPRSRELTVHPLRKHAVGVADGTTASSLYQSPCLIRSSIKIA